MQKNILAVCDLEAAYAYNLMEYMNVRRKTPFEVQAFTNIRSLELYAKNHSIELLLISAKTMCEEVKHMGIGKIMILTEGERLPEMEEYPSVYKYQASDNLIAEVMNYYAGQENAIRPEAVYKKKVEILGVYSPVQRTLKTSFALTLGQALAVRQSVLYINLEEYSGFEGLMGKTFSEDIVDLMYFLREGKGEFIYKLNGMIQNIQNLDYIPPALCGGDLREIRYEEWMKLMDGLISFSTYQTIVLDFDGHVDGLLDFLGQCDKVYMPIREDEISLAKLEQFDKMLTLHGKEKLGCKIHKLKLPFHSSFGKKENYVEQLLWGELGDYVKRLIQEEQHG